VLLVRDAQLAAGDEFPLMRRPLVPALERLLIAAA
jgi:hypothetical protein